MTWFVKTRCYVDWSLLLYKDLATLILCCWAQSHAILTGLTLTRWVRKPIPSILLFSKDTSLSDRWQVSLQVGRIKMLEIDNAVSRLQATVLMSVVHGAKQTEEDSLIS